MNKISKVIVGVLILSSLAIGVLATYNVIADLEEVNSLQHHRISELENK